MTIDQVTGPMSVGQLASRAGVRSDTIRYYERVGLLPEPDRTDGDHVREMDTELRRLTALRAELTGMLAAMPGPACPDPVPGTWCVPDLHGAEGGDQNVLVLR